MKHPLQILLVIAVLLSACVQKSAPEPVVQIKTVYKEVPANENGLCKGILDYYELFSIMEPKARKLELSDMKKSLRDTGDNCLRLKIGIVLGQPNTAIQNDRAAIKFLQRFLADSAETGAADRVLATLVLDDLKERRSIKRRLSRSYNKQVRALEEKQSGTVEIQERQKVISDEREVTNGEQQAALELLSRENAQLRQKLEQLTNIEKSISKKEQAIVAPSLNN